MKQQPQLFDPIPNPEMQKALIEKTAQFASLDALQDRIWGWAERTFPDRTDASMFLKLYGEIAELIDAGDDQEKAAKEIGDIMILILDYAARKGIRPGKATLDKLEVNLTRKWVKTSVGHYRHVK